MRFLSFVIGGRETFGVVADGGVCDVGGRLTADTGGRRAAEAGSRPPPEPGSLKAAIAARRLASAAELAVKHGPDHALDDIEFLPTIPDPGKIVCIGVNYGKRNEEYRDGADAPRYPSVFMRTADSIVGHEQAIQRPPESEQLDYEGEIVLVIGKRGRRIAAESAWDHIAGLTLMNEGSVRDWLRHGKFNVTQGKNFAGSGSLGPWLVTADEFAASGALHLTTRVNGELRQDDTTANMIFPFGYLIEYLSTFMTLDAGDLIATGTPTGAGARFDPPRYLRAGDVVEVSVPEIGTLRNRVVDEIVDPAG